MTYDQFDVSDFGSIPNIGNMGPNFNYNQLSYLIYDASTTVDLFVRGGGKETYGGYDGGSGNYALQEDSRAILHQNTTNSFIRTLPNGATEVFDLPMNIAGINYVFLTKAVDPYGNTNAFVYDDHYRLVSIVDAIGQTTTIQYASTNTNNVVWYYKISQVTDPFRAFGLF